MDCNDEEMMTKTPWIFGLRRPRYAFSPLKFTIPTSVSLPTVYFLIFVSVYYIFSGGVFNLLENPGAFNSANNVISFLSRGTNSQYLLEGIVGGSFMFIGAFFLYMIKDAAKERADRTQYYIKIFPSTVMVILSYLVLLQMFTIKTKA